MQVEADSPVVHEKRAQDAQASFFNRRF